MTDPLNISSRAGKKRKQREKSYFTNVTQAQEIEGAIKGRKVSFPEAGKTSEEHSDV